MRFTRVFKPIELREYTEQDLNRLKAACAEAGITRYTFTPSFDQIIISPCPTPEDHMKMIKAAIICGISPLCPECVKENLEKDISGEKGKKVQSCDHEFEMSV